MTKTNSVLFKGSKDGIIVLLDAEVGFESLCDELEQKIVDAKTFFGSAKCNIFLDGRELGDTEEEKLANIISSKIEIDRSYIKKREKQKGNVEKPKAATQVTQAIEFLNGFGENNTKFYKGTLRSGQKVSYNGGIVILGDVNPGAEVTASGNIIVLGALKGIVHAGCAGDNSYVVALKMSPMQLRIADVIGRADDKKSRKIEEPELAYINENMIYVEPIDQKLFVRLGDSGAKNN